MAERDLPVDEVVPGSDLEGPGPERRVDRGVGDHRDAPPRQRDEDRPADLGPVPFVVRVDGDRHVPEERLGSHRGDLNASGAPVRERIAQVEEFAVLLRVDHLEVGEGRPEPRIPVDHPLPAIDQSLPVEGEERRAGGADARGIHRVAEPRPVDGESAEVDLFPDPGFVLRTPPFDLGERPVARELVEPHPLALESPPDLDLCGEARVIDARDPDRGDALHSVRPHQDVHHGVPEHVADRQDPGDVRRRKDHRERRTVRPVGGGERAGALPLGLPFRFDRRRIEPGREGGGAHASRPPSA